MESKGAARVSSTQAVTAAAGGGAEQGAADEGGAIEEEEPGHAVGDPICDLGGVEAATTGTGEAELDVGVSIHSFDGERRRKSTLFVDGIEEAVGYHHIRGLFSLFGRISNVFVQRKHKLGRRFRFAFVRFFSEEQAASAISVLDGLRVGGAALSVAPARFPRDGPNFSAFQATRDKASLASEADPPTHTWKVVEQKAWGSSSTSVSISDEGCCLVHVNFCVERTPVEVLFPEIVSWTLGSEEMSSPAAPLLQCSFPSATGAEDEAFSDGVCLEEEVVLGQEGSGPLLPRGRGRPRKVVGCAGRGGGLVSKSARRGRPRKSDKELSLSSGSTPTILPSEVSSNGQQLMLLPPDFSEPRGVLTRARSALLMGKRMGLIYSCSDDVALNQIAAQISARGTS